MKPFYSIIYVPVRPEAKELLSVGLLMRNEKEVYFEYSRHKLDVLKELLPKQAYNLLKLSLNSLTRSVDKALDDFLSGQSGLLPGEMIETSTLQEPYFNYLSKYSKNLIAFTKPQKIELEFNYNTYQLMFKRLIDETHFIQKREEKIRDIVLETRAALKPKISDRVNCKISLHRTDVISNLWLNFYLSRK